MKTPIPSSLSTAVFAFAAILTAVSATGAVVAGAIALLIEAAFFIRAGLLP